MDRFTEKYRIIIKNVLLNYSKKKKSVPTQQYYNGSYMEESVNDFTTKIRQRKKSRKYTVIEYSKGSFNLKKSRCNNMHTFFYSDSSKFSGNF